MALPPRPIRQETLEFENLLSDLISQDRNTINYSTYSSFFYQFNLLKRDVFS